MDKEVKLSMKQSSKWKWMESKPSSPQLPCCFKSFYRLYLTLLFSDFLRVLLGPFSYRPVGFPYSVDVLDQGFHYQQCYYLDKKHHSVDKKSADLYVPANTKPSLKGDWQKRYCGGTNKVRRDVTGMGTTVQKCFRNNDINHIIYLF